MTERLADIAARIDGLTALDAVVNAMRGIAAARARQARAAVTAAEAYRATLARAIGRTLVLQASPATPAGHRAGRGVLVVFGAEQGFAGAFSQPVFAAAGPDLATAELFLIGTRAAALAAERGLAAAFTRAMPSRPQGIPKLADSIAEAVFGRIAAGGIDRLEAIFTICWPGRGRQVRRERLFPLDDTAFPAPAEAAAPLLHLAPEVLLAGLTADYLQAALCRAALQAFAAENEARIEMMAAARAQIERRLDGLQATLRRVRQAEITAEIIELGAGAAASRR